MPNPLRRSHHEQSDRARRRIQAIRGFEVMEPRSLLTSVTPTPLPFMTSYAPGHQFVMKAITLANGNSTTSGVTDTATPSILLSIENPTVPPNPPNIAFHKFLIQIIENGETLGSLSGNPGDVTTSLVVPVSAATPLQSGENDIRFKLTDVTDNLSLPLPPPIKSPIVLIYDSAPPVVTLTPPPASPPQQAFDVNVAATDLDDGVNQIQITDQFAGRPDKVTIPFNGPTDRTPAPIDYTFDPSEVGTHTLIVQATDRAGRVTTESGAYVVAALTLPTPNPPALGPASDTGFSSSDGITNAQNLTFDVTGTIAASTTVQLLRNGTVVATRMGPGALTDVNVPQSPGFVYTARQVIPGMSASPPSTPVTIVVNRTPPGGTVAVAQSDLTFTGDSTQATSVTSPDLTISLSTTSSTKPNTIFLEMLSIDGAPPAAASTTQVTIPAPQTTATVTLPVPVDLAPGVHTIVVQATDSAGNVADLPTEQFEVLANPAVGAPSTPIYDTVFNLSAIPGYDSNKREFPWSMTFDRTTQTAWVVLRGGDSQSGFDGGGERIAQLDPATGTLRMYSFRALDGQGEPHGITFDFESHIQPRVWFTEREAGYVSYLNLATNQLVSYNVGKILKEAGYANVDVHAIAIDGHGNVWVSDMSDRVIIELNFSQYPGGPPDLPLDSNSGSITIHPIPNALIGAGGLPANMDLVGPHGLDVETNDQTGAVYVWFSNLGKSGGASLLRPGAGPGGQDLWTKWDVSQALGTNPVGGAPLFIGVDEMETPGYLADDRVDFADPGSGLAPNNLIRQLIPGAPDANGNFGPGTLITWQIPALTGGGGGPVAQPNQVFPDREGNILYIDRQSGVGRFNPFSTPLANPQNTNTVPSSTYANSPGPLDGPDLLTPFRIINDASLLTTVNLPMTSSTIADTSPESGLNQYVITPTSPSVGGGKASGPFRSTINAGSTIYASLTQNDELTSAVFAEMARRPVAVVNGPGDARRAFQVLRSGDIIMTWHGPGQILDQQVDLTAAVGGPQFVGDAAAATDASGDVEVFGRDSRGGISEYRLDAASQTWSILLLPPPTAAEGSLASDPTPFTDPQGNVELLTTTGLGHLLEYFPQTGQIVDLSAQAAWNGAGPVYSSVGETELGSNDYVYATNQKGGLVQVVLGSSGNFIQAALLSIPGGRDTEVFQDVAAVTDGSLQYVFAADGASRIVAIVVGPSGVISAQNVTELADTGQATVSGYSAYQMPFAGRVYGDLSAAVDPTNGDIYVEGNNGRDLVEFHLAAAPGSRWQVTDLTNALPANKVFGTPAIYILPNGDRHILMINEDAEMIEYYNLVPGQLSTQNITLSLGNSGSPPGFPMTFAAAAAQLQQGAIETVVPKIKHHRAKHHPHGPKIAAHEPKPHHPRPAAGLTPINAGEKRLSRRIGFPHTSAKHHVAARKSAARKIIRV
jgi:hypothetical protein